ncbi:MAG: WD40 repeat domain-containing protein, partial [Gemmataceae bacterium]
RFSADGTTLYGGGLDGAVCRWALKGDALTPLPPLKGHAGWVQALAVRADGRVFSGDSWGRLIAWQDGKPARDATPGGWVRKLALSPDGKTLASGDSAGAVRLWDADTLKLRKEVAHGTDVMALAYGPDGTLYYGDLRGTVVRNDGAKEVRRYDAGGMYLLSRIQDVGGVRCLTVSPDGKTLAAGGSKPTVGGFVQGAAMVAYFEADTGKPTQALTFGGDNEGFVLDAHWHPSGVLTGVTSGQPGSGQLFFHRPGEPAVTAGAKLANGHSLAVHPDGTRVVAMTTLRIGGNGRGTGKDYPANTTPLHVFRVG